MTFVEESQLERIGDRCFRGSGIEEITLPSTLKKIGEYTFSSCEGLKIIYLEDECLAELVDTVIPKFTSIIPLSVVLPGGMSLQSITSLKNVVIPEGTERIGNKWFWGSRIESIEIPCSVKEIGKCAFRNCKNLRQITFSGSS